MKYDWLATPSIASGDALAEYDAVWVVPGSPYRHPEGAFTAIRYARENSIPFLGTCGGFQHAVIEYAVTCSAGRMPVMRKPTAKGGW